MIHASSGEFLGGNLSYEHHSLEPSVSNDSEGDPRVRLPEGVLRLALTLDFAFSPERGPGSGPLLRSLRSGRARNLREAYRSLPDHQQNKIRSGVTPSLLNQMFSLSRERDPEFLANGTYAVARRMLRQEDPELNQLGAGLLGMLAEDNTELGREAGLRLDAMNGAGPTSYRIQNAVSSASRQFVQPALWISLALGSAAFRLTYAGALSRFTAGGSVRSMAQLWGARAGAGTLALGAEVPTWILAENSLRYAFGEKVDFSADSLLTQAYSAGILMGTMRLTHLGGRLLARQTRAAALRRPLEMSPLRPNVHEILMPPASMLGGAYTAFLIQERLDLRDNHGSWNRLMDAGIFSVHAMSASYMSRWMMGRGWARMNRNLEQRIQRIERNAEPIHWGHRINNWIPTLGPRLAVAGVGEIPASGVVETRGPSRSHIMLSQALDGSTPEGSRSSPLSSEVIEGRFEQMTRPNFKNGMVERSTLPESEGNPKIQRVGVLNSGGNGPGENAALARLEYSARLMHGWELVGIFDGFKGLVNPRGTFSLGQNPQGRIWFIKPEDLHGPNAVLQAHRMMYGVEGSLNGNGHDGISHLGGDLLRSSRFNPLEGDPRASQVKSTMDQYGIDALVVLGGNGSQRASMELSAEGIPLVFLPQSIDGDVPGSAISIGFPSAVNRAALGFSGNHVVGRSCGNTFLLEIMGQHYGLLTLGSALNARKGHYAFNGGHLGPPVRVDGVFTEIPRSIDDIGAAIQRAEAQGQRHAVIALSEGVQFTEVEPPRAKDMRGRLQIESGDIAKWVRREMAARGITAIRTKALGYELRGTNPIDPDINLAEHLSDGALTLISRGAFGRMVGIDFIENSARMTLRYPRLEDAVQNPKILRPDYFDFVRDYLEGD